MSKTIKTGGGVVRRRSSSSSFSSQSSPRSSFPPFPTTSPARRTGSSIPIFNEPSSPPMSPSSRPVSTPRRKCGTVFTVQFCNFMSTTGLNGMMENRAAASEFAGSGGYAKKRPTRRLVPLRPDLNIPQQRAMVKMEKSVKRAKLLDEDARGSTFVLPGGSTGWTAPSSAKTEENTLDANEKQQSSTNNKQREEEDQHFSSMTRGKMMTTTVVKDMQYRLKGLVALSQWHHQTLHKQRQSKSKGRSGDGNGKRKMRDLRATSNNSGGADGADGADSGHNSAAFITVGSPTFFQYLTDDIDVMFKYCLEHENTANSPVDGAAFAYRHIVGQLAKFRLWDEPLFSQ